MAADDNERFDVEILGAVIGTADGWDSFGDNGQQFYHFEPNEKFKPFFHGDVEPETVCLDPFTEDKERILVGYLDETEILYDHKKFLTLLIKE